MSDELKKMGGGLDITRRDYLGGALAGAGGLLLSGLTPGQLLAGGYKPDLEHIDPREALIFDGPAGTGDYRVSNGNTWDVLSRAHRIRDGVYEDTAYDQIPVSEDHYDVVMVGGGASSLGATYFLNKETKGKIKGLILENHRIFGGEAKLNQFQVGGHTIYGPQGSNLMILPSFSGQKALGDDLLFDEYKDIGMPLNYELETVQGTDKKLEFDVSNYMYLWLGSISESLAHYAGPTKENPNPAPVLNPWMQGMEGLGFSEQTRKDLEKWQWGLSLDRPKEGLEQWLDQMSYKDLLIKEHKLSPEVVKFADPLVASAVGLGSRSCSAYVATKLAEMPGAALSSERTPEDLANPAMKSLTGLITGFNVACFPGGNSYPYRYFANHIWPGLIKDLKNPGDMVGNDLNHDVLDQKNNAFRMRTAATVVDVRHLKGSNGKKVRVIYEKDGALHAVISKTVIVSSGSWVSRNILGDVPEDIHQALSGFKYAPFIVANVALKNWRFMEKMGITAAVYHGGEFGFTCNIRQPMKVGNYQAPFDPDKPIVLTFYAPLTDTSVPLEDEATSLRWELFGTPYRDIELKIRKQMVQLFNRGGFDPARDIAGITLNRWGHAYVVPEPGFFHPLSGGKSNSDIIREGYGHIYFAHSELRGLQAFAGAYAEGQRAARQVLKSI